MKGRKRKTRGRTPTKDSRRHGITQSHQRFNMKSRKITNAVT